MKVLVGSRHDAYCLGESGLLDALDPGNWAGDKGFVGYAMITPFKKPPGGELLEWQKEYNTQLYKICWVIEQVIWELQDAGSCTRITDGRSRPSQRPSQPS